MCVFVFVIITNSDLTTNDLFMQILRVEEVVNLSQQMKKKIHRKGQMRAYFLEDLLLWDSSEQPKRIFQAIFAAQRKARPAWGR